MKYFKNGKVYVSYNDLINLPQLSEVGSSDLVRKGLGEGPKEIDDSNRFLFAEFDLPEEVEFFSNRDWIIDYGEYKNMSDEELEKTAQKIFLKNQLLIETYNNMSEQEQDNNYEVIREHMRLWHQFKDLRYIYEYRCGNIALNIPEDIDSISYDTKDVFKQIVEKDLYQTKEKSLIKRIIDSINKKNSVTK